jgi:hypothetical protein
MNLLMNRTVSTMALILPLFWVSSLAAEEIVAMPGTYELLEGKSMQFDARQKDDKLAVEGYESIIKLAGQSQYRSTIFPDGHSSGTGNLLPFCKRPGTQFTMVACFQQMASNAK